MNLRYYQAEAKDTTLDNIAQEKLRNLLVIPTGGGKSIIMAFLAQGILKLPGFKNKKILYLSHRKELDQQNCEALNQINPYVQTGFEKGTKKCDPQTQIMFASILSVGKTNLERLKTWTNQDLTQIGAVFIDEAHHIPGGKTYKVLLKELQEANPQLIVTGLTATPNRMDGESLEPFLDQISYQVELEELIQAGYLATIKGITVKTQTSLEGITGRDDFVEEKLSEKIDNQTRNELAVKTYLENQKGKKAIAFCINKAHAHHFKQTCQENGVRCAVITEDTPAKERDSIKADVKAGKYDIIANVSCLTEGFDLPEVECLLMLRPTKSPVLQCQMLGRGMRLVFERDPNDPEGPWIVRLDLKPHCSVYDFVDLQAIEVGALTLTDFAGIPNQPELDGEDLFELKAKIKIATQNPLTANSLKNIKRAGNIETFLLPTDILAKLKLTQKNNDTELPWIEGNNNSHYLALKHGELCQIHQDARGVYFLEHPKIDMERRELERRKYRRNNFRNDSRQIIPPNVPARKIQIPIPESRNKKKNIKAVLQAATNLLSRPLEYDRPLLDKNAKWRAKAVFEKPSPEQVKRLLKKNIMGRKEIESLSKPEVSDLITLEETKEETFRFQGRLPSGRYEGLKIEEIAIRNPEYCQFIISKKSAKSWKIEDELQKALDTFPETWLKKDQPGIYHRYIKPIQEQLEKSWKTNPDAVRQQISKALATNPADHWPTYQKIAEDRRAKAIEIQKENRATKVALDP